MHKRDAVELGDICWLNAVRRQLTALTQASLPATLDHRQQALSLVGDEATNRR